VSSELTPLRCCRAFSSLHQINSELLAGIVVDFGDKTIDLSAASKVNKLNGLLTR